MTPANAAPATPLQPFFLPATLMRANLEAVFAHYGLPELSPTEEYSDRSRWRATHGFLGRLAQLTEQRKFRPWPKSLAGNHGVTVAGSWRENVPRWSCQIVWHWLGGLAPGYIEADVDSINPDFGLAYLLWHGVDIKIHPPPTPERVREALAKRGISAPLMKLRAPEFIKSEPKETI